MVEDRSGIDDEAQYRCKSSDCRMLGKPWLGKELLPIVSEELKDDPTHKGGPIREGGRWYPPGIVGTGRFICYVRRCPACRGDMEKVEVKQGSTVHEVGCPCGFCKAGWTKG